MKSKRTVQQKNQTTASISSAESSNRMEHDTAYSSTIKLDINAAPSSEASRKKTDMEIEQEGRALLTKAILSWKPKASANKTYSADTATLLHRIICENIERTDKKSDTKETDPKTSND